MNGGRFASEFVDGIDESLVDFAVEGLVHDLDGFRCGDAEAADEAGFEPGFFHGG